MVTHVEASGAFNTSEIFWATSGVIGSFSFKIRVIKSETTSICLAKSSALTPRCSSSSAKIPPGWGGLNSFAISN